MREQDQEALVTAISRLGQISVICFDRDGSPRQQPGNIARSALRDIHRLLGNEQYDALAARAALSKSTQPLEKEGGR